MMLAVTLLLWGVPGAAAAGHTGAARLQASASRPGALCQARKHGRAGKKGRKRRKRKRGGKGKPPRHDIDAAPLTAPTPTESTTAAKSPSDTAPPAPAEPTGPPPPLPKDHRSVAVLAVRGLDVGEELLHDIEVALVNEVDETMGMQGISPADVQTDLEAYGLSLAQCAGELSCLARAARYAKAHLGLDAKVAALGGTLSISMRLIDSQTISEVGRVADPISDDPAKRALELHHLAVRLLAPDTYVGSLSVEASVDGAEVYLDDRLVGTTPLPGPVEKLTAGPHILRVSKAGFADVNQFVDVIYKRSSTMNVDLANATIAGKIVEIESKTGFGAVFVVANADGVQVRIDGEPRGSTPFEQPIEKVEAGKRRLSLRKEGLPALTARVEIKVGKILVVGATVGDKAITLGQIRTIEASAPLPIYAELTKAPVADVKLPPPPHRLGWKFYAGTVSAGLGAISLLTSSYYSRQVVHERDKQARVLHKRLPAASEKGDDAEVERLLRNLTGDGGQLKGINSRGDTDETLQWVTLGAGVILAGVGAGLIAWSFQSQPSATLQAGPEPARASSSLQLGLSPTPGGGQLLLVGDF